MPQFCQFATILFTKIVRWIALISITFIFLNIRTVSGQDVNTYQKNTYTYKNTDNHQIQANVYRYPSAESQPAIIWIHGGALIFGSRDWISPEQLDQYLTAGFTVVSIDYRLAPETKLDKIIEDIEDAYKWVLIQGTGLFNIDPNRIAVVGHSAGGYLTLVSGFRLKPSPKALVSFYGYGDLTGPWYSEPDSFYNQMPIIPAAHISKFIGDTIVSNTNWPTERSKFYLYCRQNGLWPSKVAGRDPVKDKVWFSQFEPLRNVSSTYPPTLLLHGKKDTDVPYEQSVLMSRAFERHKVDYEFITNPNWGHGFDFAGMEDPSVQEAFNNILKFLDKHLQ